MDVSVAQTSPPQQPSDTLSSPITASSTNIPTPSIDETVFESPTFDPINWINTNLTSDNPSTQASSLLTSLQTSFLSAHTTFTDSLQSATRAVPTAVRDVEKLRLRTTSLRSTVDGVGQRVLSAESGVAESAATISSADALVQRVQTAVTLLKKAWEAERLLDRLDALMAATKGDGSELVTAADVLQQVRVCLEGLENIKELNDRRERLEGFDKRLDGLAKPRLKTALVERNVQLAANVRTVFSRAGRESSFATQYVSIRTDEVQKLWRNALDKSLTASSDTTNDTGERGSETKRGALVRDSDIIDLGSDRHRQAYEDFTTQLSQILREEIKYLQEAFPEIARDLLSSLVSCALPSLSPPLPTANTLPVNPQSAARTLQNLEKCSTAAMKLCLVLMPMILLEDSTLLSVENEGILEVANAAPEGTTSDQKQSPTFEGPLTVLSTILSVPLLIYEAFLKILLQFSTHLATQIPYTAPLSLPGLSSNLKAIIPSVLTIPETLRTLTSNHTFGYFRQSFLDAVRVAENITSDRLSQSFKQCLRNASSQKRNAASSGWKELQDGLRLLNAITEMVVRWRERRVRESEACVDACRSESVLFGVIDTLNNDKDERKQEMLLRKFCDYAVKENKLKAARFLWYRVQYSGGNESENDEIGVAGENGESQDIDGKENQLDTRPSGYNMLIRLIKKEVHRRMMTGIRNCYTKMRRVNWGEERREDEYAGRSPSQYVTDMADWLMTIPQQLEPFIPQDEGVAELATPRVGEVEGYKRDDEGVGSEGDEKERNLSFASGWIDASATAAMGMYWNEIDSLPKLSAAKTDQLATDVEYVLNVMSALGVKPSENLQLIKLLLESPAEVEVFEDFVRADMPAERKLIARRIAALRGIRIRV